MKQTFIDKLALLDIKDKKLLFALSKGKNSWFLPGGKRESSEPSPQSEIAKIGYFGYNTVPKITITGQMVLDDLKSKNFIS